MTIGLSWKNLLSRGDITLQHDGLSLDDGLVTLVLICLFTDARADADDEIPGGSGDPRGWPGDSFSNYPWGSKLWLLEREKLTEAIRLRVTDYATLSIRPLLRAGYVRTAEVTATIAASDRINFIVVLTRPDKSVLTIQLSRRWESAANAI